MVEITFSEHRHGKIHRPTCNVTGYEIVTDLFISGLDSTRSPLNEVYRSCKSVADDSVAEATVGGSEAHIINVRKPDVIIERTYLPDTVDPYEWREYPVPFDVFFDALSQWRKYVLDFEKRNPPSGHQQ